MYYTYPYICNSLAALTQPIIKVRRHLSSLAVIGRASAASEVTLS